MPNNELIPVNSGALTTIPNIAELASYVPAPPPNAGEFLPYVHMHWPVQGPGKSYCLQLTDGGKANAMWMEWPFIMSVLFARGGAKVPNLTSPEDTEWAFEPMPGMHTASADRYRAMMSGQVAGVEKGTSYMLALWKQGVDTPMLVTFDAFKTMNNATFTRLAEARSNLKKGIQFPNGDLTTVMQQSPKTGRWFPDAGRFGSYTRLVDLSPNDLEAVRDAMSKNEKKVMSWLNR